MYDLFYLLFYAYIEHSAYIAYTSDIRRCLRMWGFLVGVRKKGQRAYCLPPELTETAPRYTTRLIMLNCSDD